MNSILQKSGYLATVALLGTYAMYTLRGPDGVPGLLQKRSEIHQLEVQKATLRAEIDLKKKRIYDLKNSKAAQDEAIRERLQLVGPKDTRFVLPAPSTKSAQ